MSRSLEVMTSCSLEKLCIRLLFFSLSHENLNYNNLQFGIFFSYIALPPIRH
ncbi:hypothetical protein HanRHA438_Chr12g0547381 [Helianthus annuus]|nr:hypothetical protein HanRHA438_Chr12g0547381 [Helianthus annuus]